MSEGVAVRQVLEVVSRCCLELSGVRFYLFGSILDPSVKSFDIDLLVMYEDVAHPVIVKGVLEKLLLPIPLDVIYMTPKENIELRFVELLDKKLEVSANIDSVIDRIFSI